MQEAPSSAGSPTQDATLALLSLRLVTGWLFFSALWRRLVLEPEKMVPDAAGYVGEKFNHFLPHAIGVRGLLDWLVRHPEVLHPFLVVFTVLEGAAGLGLMLGLLTRAAAAGVVMLSGGILLGAGWIGSTCLDEWQIGVLGIAGGMSVVFGGAGRFGLDAALTSRFPRLRASRAFALLASGPLPLRPGIVRRGGIALAGATLALTLATNQIFFGGVWGKLHNHSVRPHVTIAVAELDPAGALRLKLARDGGPDTYGAFIVDIVILDGAGKPVHGWDARALASLPASAITNHYLVKVHPGPHGLVLPLGSVADVVLPIPSEVPSPGHSRVRVSDVSGAVWEAGLDITPRLATRE
ncbi:TQO small subunit DoxD [Polyangium fumosum]|uniref:Quinol oxidase n=1 Tax=Polyangium fumosum TaxID=889272 RepID=A0A4U1IUG4_9BACT|nr:TQO small subunit DoxD [Polyangium fumosum]TKC98069.1 quinol oxidase [Polyangium fumosum]